MINLQNKSSAVMAQRFEPAHSLDDFPTPPWATRALVEHVIGVGEVRDRNCLEPACGRGHMARALEEYFDHVTASDTSEYGFGEQCDFLRYHPTKKMDWVITNPPFRLAESFLSQAYSIATHGIALLVHTAFVEGVGRHKRVFSKFPPTVVAQFTERVPMFKGRLNAKGSTATAYAWFVWKEARNG